MHKKSHQNAGNGIKESLFFKIFLGSMPLDPLEVLAPLVRVGQIPVSLRSRRYSRAQGEKLEIPPAQKLSILSSPAAG